MAPTEGRVARPERRWGCRRGTPRHYRQQKIRQQTKCWQALLLVHNYWLKARSHAENLSNGLFKLNDFFHAFWYCSVIAGGATQQHGNVCHKLQISSKNLHIQNVILVQCHRLSKVYSSFYSVQKKSLTRPYIHILLSHKAVIVFNNFSIITKILVSLILFAFWFLVRQY